MANPCKVIITRGKNKGKQCGTVNLKCKHVSEPLVCSVCKMEFDRTTSYYRHINTHHDGRAKPSYKIKVAVNVKNPSPPSTVPVSNVIETRVASQSASTPGSSSVPDSGHHPEMTKVYNRLMQLEELNNALREEVEELKLKPTTTNYIAILGNDFYTELTNKIGRAGAMKFLAEKGTKSPLSVFQKLYIDDRDPDDYPIACRDKNHFRYLDEQQRMVDDHGGSTIGNTMSQRLTDAVEHAVHDFEIEGHGNTVYGLENVKRLKERFAKLDQNSVIKELAYMTNNPNHPFFRDED